MDLIEFQCRGYRFALPLGCVRRVLPSAKPTPLSGTPEIVMGILNVGGDVVTVVDFCQRIGLPSTHIIPSQRLLVIQISAALIAFIVDDVTGVVHRELGSAEQLPDKLERAEFVSGIVRLDDGLSVVIDPAKFLFDEELHQLNHALEATAYG